MATDPLEERLRAVEADEPPAPMTDKQLVDGAAFAFDPSLDLPRALWGRDDEIVVAKGEPALFVGPQGIGKTTLAQRYTLARTGIGDTDLLGYPVEVSERPILYVAADRPVQAQRSFRRMVDESMRELLAQRVYFWKGALPFDVAREPDALVRFVTDLGDFGDVVLDSLKDLAVGLAKDEVGSAVNRALQLLIAEGIEVVGNHHQRKASSDNRKPKQLDDVYGSNWITAGCGSVILLWGQPGDPVVELSHLKQPSSPVGPFQVDLDHDMGKVVMTEGTDLLAMLRGASRGMSAIEGARMLYGATEPSRAEVEKARRKLDKLASCNLAVRREGDGGFATAVRWFATPSSGLQEPLE